MPEEVRAWEGLGLTSADSDSSSVSFIKSFSFEVFGKFSLCHTNTNFAKNCKLFEAAIE